MDAESVTTGATDGEFFVDAQGSANYRIPLLTAPGSGGLAPQMSLQYNSQGANDVAGVGWSIGGQSAISRCPQTREQDGIDGKRSVSLDWFDRFCLDGQRLMAVKGVYGADGTEYRMEIDDFSRVVSRGQAGKGPAWFEVWHGNGSVSYYGNSQDSRIEARVPGDSDSVMTWALNRQQDGAGNYIDYRYQEQEGVPVEVTLASVNYTGNVRAGTQPYAEMRFHYSTGRNDVPDSRVVGGKYSRKRLLTRIDSLARAGSAGSPMQSLRSWFLAYGQDGFGRKVLESVEECSDSGKAYCFEPTGFSWLKNENVIGENGVGAGHLFPRLFKGLTLADVNGDGRRDLLILEGDNPFYFKIAHANADGSFQPGTDSYPVPAGTETDRPVQLLTIDMDADGFQDVIYPKKGASGVNWVARLSDSHGFGKEIIVAEGCCDYLEPKVASVVDFNGDGLADLVTHTAVDSSSWQGTLVVLVNGSGSGGSVGFESPTPLVVDYSADLFPEDVNRQWFLKNGAPGFREVIDRSPDAVQVFDYNGDGNVDLLARVDRSYVHCGLNCNTTAAVRAMSTLPPGFDFESNPPADGDEGYYNVGFYIIFESDGAGRYSQKAVVAKEAKFGCDVPVACEPWSGLPDVEQIFPVDINGDGLADLAYRDREGEWFYRVNTGAGFETPEPVTRIQDAEISEYARFIDVSGDGYPEFLYPSALENNSATWKVHSNDLGNGFGAAESTRIRFGHNTEGDNSILHDFNGDGMVDSLFIDFRAGRVRGTSTVLYPGVNLVTGQSHQAANVISGITDGFGKKIQLRYGALTDPAVHTRLTNATEADWGRGSAVFDLAAPVFVVRAVSTSAPTFNSSSSMRETEYHYVGARLQAGGRGFLGFAEVIQWSPDSGIRSNTRYRQDFPYSGLPAEVLQELADHSSRMQSLSSLDPDSLSGWPEITPATPSPGAALAGETIGYSASSWRHAETFQGQGAWSRSQVARMESAWSPRGELIKKTFVSNVNGEYGRLEKSVEQTWGDDSSQPLLTMTSTSEFYPADLVRWNLNRVSGVVVKHQRPNVAAVERKSAFEYDPASGRTSKETTEPSSSEFRVVSAYQLDLFGNRIQTTVSANGVAARTSRIEFDSLGRFAVAEYNHYGQQVMRVHQWNPFGTPVNVSDIDGVVTSSATDPMGRVFGSWTETGSWDWKVLGRGPGQVCPAGTAFHHRTRFGGKPAVHACFDLLHREIRSAKESFDGRMVYTDTGFDLQGRVQRVSEPYFQGDARYWNTTGYDPIGRILEVESAGGDDLFMAYGASASAHCGVTSPHALETTNGLGHKQLEVRNALGEPTAVYDNHCGKVTYSYDAIGNLVEVVGVDGNRTRMSYDLAGRKVSTSDPDKGYWQYQWNGLGELLRQLDAKGQAMDYRYDDMGRVTRRRELSSVDSIDDSTYRIEHQELTWWQNATAATVPGKGQPKRISYQDGSGSLVHQKEFTYDDLGRVSVVASDIGGMRFSEETTYDQFARTFQEFDASGDYRGIRYRYNEYGYLDQVVESREGEEGTVYRDIGATDARGNVTFARLGNGVEVFASHHADSGQLRSLEAYDSAGRELQDVEYLFDVLGNLQQRSDRSDGRDLTEDFSYDSLNRLVRVELTAPANFITTPSETLALEYDASGNIRWKSDVGAYLYGGGGAGPHAVSFADGQAYRYDANGNQTSGDGRTVSYSVFDKAVRIERNGQFTEFSYGIAHRRIKRVDSNAVDGQNTTHYVGNVEYVEGENGSHFKRQLAGTAIVRFYPASGRSEARYVVKDHLGSPHNLTSEEGRLEDAVWMHFGALGQRRVSTWDGPPGLSATVDLNRLSNRGFTGHEQVDAMGLIHMNGRVYDPKLGRFLQADPLVQAAGDGQALNRYSYALNNPLSYTDPSGYSLKRFVKRWGRLIVALALSAILPGGQGILATSFGIGNVYAQAAITGFIAGVITSGNLKGAVIGALTAVAVAGIVQANTAAKASSGLAADDKLIPKDYLKNHLCGDNGYSEGLYRILVDENGVVSNYDLVTAPGLVDGDVIFTNGIRNDFGHAVRNATRHLHQAGLLKESYILNFNPTQGTFADLFEASRDILGAHTGWTHSGLAKNLAGVLDQATQSGVSGLQLVGHSQGGAITASALRYAGKAGLNLSSLAGGGVALHGAPVNAWMARSRLADRVGVRIVSRHQFGDAVHVLGGLNVTNPLEVPIALLRVPALFSADTGLNPHSLPCGGRTSLVCVH
ncbi:MAG: RHS repeat-associated core domain-containing protein [Xanthomonadales bacterium]|nr:RHS repeat-associated core domain-containing protein [Xanthomonadales bacterium]